MEVLKANSTSALMEVDIGDSVESLQRFVESQADLFNSQVDQLQKIVVSQCKLTGVNPLSQEMAAGALSINIGKRPRDLLNPKAVKYMQAVFSIKDTLKKKETREISALCGVTQTQVREFFAGQRSRVRKLVRLSREKAVKSEVDNRSHNGCSSSTDLAIPIFNPVPLKTMDPNPVPLKTMDPNPVPLKTEESPSCSTQEENIPGIDDFDKNFITNIFNLMRKEGTFSGEVKLIEWILQIQNTAVLYWFVNKGGLAILAVWLSQAALEEQTTVLEAVLKVLCHLPLHKALPEQMSAILQAVNRLRFYRTSDISNRAKILLARWSKLFVRSQALRKSITTNSHNNAQKVNNLQLSEMSMDWQSNIDLSEEILSLAYASVDDCRKSDPSPSLRLLQASPDDSSKKQIRGVASVQTRERRKVLPMEQTDRSATGRSLQVTRVIPSNHRPLSADDIQKAKIRALHMQSKYGKTSASPKKNQQQKAEDTNKSSTYQSNHLVSVSDLPVKSQIEEPKKPAILPSDASSTPPKAVPDLKPRVSPPQQSLLDNSPTPPKAIPYSKPRVSPQQPLPENPPTPPKPVLYSKPRVSPQPLLEKLKSKQILWHSPPEVNIDSGWRVSNGENSREVEIQIGRMQREKATIYHRVQDIPPNPKEPWDFEMDFDDSLTPVIPIEQSSDSDVTDQLLSPRSITQELPALSLRTVENASETSGSATTPPQTLSVSTIPLQTSAPMVVQTAAAMPVQTSASMAVQTPAAAITSTSIVAPLEPDFELLAVLMKNPDLVFALTSGQGTTISREDTVKLLDLIKRNGACLSGVSNTFGGNTKEEVVTSLPSPTPSAPTTSLPSPTPAQRQTNGWISDVTTASISQPNLASNRESYSQPISASNRESFSQPSSVNNRESYDYAQAAFSAPSQEHPSTSYTQSQDQRSSFWQHQAATTTLLPPSQQLPYQSNMYSGLNQLSNPSSGQQQHNLTVSRMNPTQNQAYPTINQLQNFRGSNQPETRNYGYQNGNPTMQQPEMLNYGYIQNGNQTIQQPEMLNYGQMQAVKPAQVTILMNDTRTMTYPQEVQQQQPFRLPDPSSQWNTVGSSRQTRVTNLWSRVNQNNYNRNGSVPQPLPANTSWERNEYVAGEPPYESWSPDGSPVRRSRSPDYRSGRNYSAPKKVSGWDVLPDSPQRPWDSGRHDNRQDYRQGSNRRWRDKRY